jgi:hypothetical protein
MYPFSENSTTTALQLVQAGSKAVDEARYTRRGKGLKGAELAANAPSVSAALRSTRPGKRREGRD